MRLIIHQPKKVIERQKKFIEERYPADEFKFILYLIFIWSIALWCLGVAPVTFKYIGMSAYLLIFMLQWYYSREYDKQVEEGFKRKWVAEELNKQNVEKWLCENISSEDGNVTLGSLLSFSTMYAVIATISLWVLVNTIYTILQIIYYVVCGIGLVTRITFEGTHPALATIEPIDIAFGTLSIIILYALCLTFNKILSLKIIKCSRGKQ